MYNQDHGRVRVSYQADIAWRHSVFLTQNEKGPILITGYNGQEERLRWKAFQQAQKFPPTGHTLAFFRWKNFLIQSDSEVTEQNLACYVSKNTPIMMKNKHPIHIIVIRVVNSDGYVMLSFMFPYGLSSHGCLCIMVREGSSDLDWEGARWNHLRLARDYCAVSHKQENPVLAVRKFPWPHHF